MPSANRTRPSAVRDTVRFMLDRHHFQDAYATLERAVNDLRQARAWRVLRQIWEVPQAQGGKRFEVDHPALVAERPWRILIARILTGCQDEDELETWVQRCFNATGQLEPELVVMRAFALICAGAYRDVQSSLQAVLSQLEGYWLGVAHQRLLWAAHRLHEPWDHHVLEARACLQDRALGLMLLDAATCAYSEHRDALAHSFALEALEFLAGDAYHATWANLQIGLNLLRETDPTAETYFRTALALTQQSAAHPLRAKALASLGALRRVQGEWRIALELYRRAEQFAMKDSDALELLGIRLNAARTLRLAGRPEESIERLLEALAASPQHADALRLELSAAYLRVGRDDAARAALERIEAVFGADVYLRTMLEAELWRRSGRVEEARNRLERVPMTTRVTREESRQFPDLFDLIPDLEARPIPLEYPERTVVRVLKTSNLQVFVNDRSLEGFEEDTQDVAAFLHLLRTPNTRVKTDDLAVALFALEDIEQLETEFRDLTNKIVARLRHKLGYAESVRQDRRSYWLDPDTTWSLEQA
jgi:tetratricopeptide (TPR) repeat protein